MKAANIIQGWATVAHELITDKDPSDITKARAKTCASCKFNRQGKYLDMIKGNIKEIEGKVCGVCHCPLIAKVRSINESCPRNKWEK